RAGAEGSAMCLVTPANTGKWNAINRLMNPGATGKKPNEQKYKKRPGKPAGFKNNGKKYNRGINRVAA
ncbi:hypothetical protein SAMN05216326_16013, partial [Nitrosomonas marina]